MLITEETALDHEKYLFQHTQKKTFLISSLPEAVKHVFFVPEMTPFLFLNPLSDDLIQHDLAFCSKDQNKQPEVSLQSFPAIKFE